MKKKATRSLRWVRLDNAAKIYPAARRKNWSNVFRQSVTLFDDVDTGVLKSALDITVKRFPSIAARLRKGKLYIIGGALMILGAFMLLIEFLMGTTFNLQFIGWSIYPLCELLLFGGLLIYLAINSAARETMERKLFF